MAILERLKNKQRYQTYKFFYESPEGKVILADMCRAHGVFNSAFDPDPYEHARMAGERNAVLRILTILNLTPEEVAELDQED